MLVPYIQNINPDISREQINELYIKASLGKISSQNFWYTLGLVNEYEQIERKYLDTCLTLDRDFISVADELIAEYDLAILSNDVKKWGEYLREKYNLNRLFKEIVISGEVGYRKPDYSIYDILLLKLNVTPQNCVFIDDRYKNLKAASERGFKTIRFCREPLEKDFEPDAEINSFTELMKTIKDIW